MKKAAPLALVGLIAALAACTERDLGTGINTVDREYSRPVGDMHKASLDAVKATGLTLESEKHDELGGEIIARRADGSKVRITLRSISQNATHVSVRVDPGDKELAELIHQRISENAGVGR